MSTARSRARLAALALAAPLVLGTAGPIAPAAEASPAAPGRTHTPSGPDVLPLPAGFQPEGITVGRGATAYLGSRADGDVVALDLRTGALRTVAQGPGTASVGLKIDQRGRLFVAGGPAGEVRVIDARSGALLARYPLTAAGQPTFINDVVLTRDAAWVTDSRNAVLHRIPFGRHGALPSAAEPLPLSGDWVQTPGVNNANGLTTTPDGDALLVVNSSNGLLYRVDTATGAARAVDLGGYVLTNGDGLLREGRTLYVVQNRLNTLAVLRLNRSGTRGELRTTVTGPAFDVPTTVARSGDRLYLPNARFTTPAEPTTTYDVTAVRVPRR